MDKLKIFDAGQKNELSKKVCKILRIKPSNAERIKFKDGDLSWNINENVRGTDVFVFQSYYGHKGQRLYELDLLLNGLKSGACKRLRVVMPFAFGSRAERKTKPKQPINSVVIAQNLKARGVDGLLTQNIHTRTIGSTYDSLGMLFDNLEFEPIAAHYFASIAKQNKKYEFILNSPDAGGMERIRYVSKLMRENLNVEAGLSMIHKHRSRPNVSEIFDIIGCVKDKMIGIYDDIGDTLGTLVGGAEELKKRGALKVYAAYPHAVHSEDAEEKIEKALSDGTIEEILISDTIPLSQKMKKHKKVSIISVAPLIAEGIKQIHNDGSISNLHKYEPVIKLYKDQGIIE